MLLGANSYCYDRRLNTAMNATFYDNLIGHSDFCGNVKVTKKGQRSISGGNEGVGFVQDSCNYSCISNVETDILH